MQTFMGVLVTCKNKEDPLKNEGARVVTTDLSLSLFRFLMTLKGSLLHSLRLVLL